ncbi:unnamed protein product [Lepidochelys kempii]
MTLMVHFVITTEPSENVHAMVTVREHFLEFIDIDDTTGAGMTNVLLKKLEDTGIAIADMRGQAYDNGANMRGKNRGVQTRIRELKPRAFFVPCSSHSLNLVVSDAASASSEAAEFFNVIFLCINSSMENFEATSGNMLSDTETTECHTMGKSREGDKAYQTPNWEDR